MIESARPLTRNTAAPRFLVLGRYIPVACLGLAMLACSPQARQSSTAPTQPAAQDQIAPQDKMPGFWREAKRHVSFAGAASNLTLISRAVGEGMYRHMGPGFVWAVFGARSQSSYAGVVAVGEGDVDFAMTTPPANARLAMEGKGYFKKAYPSLRAIAVWPQNDWISCVVLDKFGISSFEDMKSKKAALRIATGPMGTTNGVGFAVERLLEAYGITVQDVEAWGGKLVEAATAEESVRKVLSGEADMACHEAWSAFSRFAEEKIPVKFLPVNDAVLNQIEQQLGFRRNVIRKGIYGPNVPDRDIPVVDRSDWVMITSTSLPDDLAYLAAKVAVEDRADLEILYMGYPENERSMDLPIKPEMMWKNVGVPLHPGAERYYREAGYIR